MSSGSVVLPGTRVTVDELLGQLSLPPDLVAISLVNGLQRARSHRLVEGDVVKLVPIMGGG
jgi:sulfur carrier protein ThiS